MSDFYGIEPGAIPGFADAGDGKFIGVQGLPEHTVIVKHGLRAALTPIITIFGMDLGALLGGAVLTEVTFSLHGLGQFTILAIDTQDLPEILGVTLLAAFFIVIANLVVDILYAVVDPRVRVSS